MPSAAVSAADATTLVAAAVAVVAEAVCTAAAGTACGSELQRIHCLLAVRVRLVLPAGAVAAATAVRAVRCSWRWCWWCVRLRFPPAAQSSYTQVVVTKGKLAAFQGKFALFHDSSTPTS